MRRFLLYLVIAVSLVWELQDGKKGEAQTRQAEKSPGCVAVSVAKYEGTDIDNYVLTNNCGKYTTLYFTLPPNSPIRDLKIDLDTGESHATGINTTWSYKIWGCFDHQTPVDADTSVQPKYDSSHVVCQ